VIQFSAAETRRGYAQLTQPTPTRMSNDHSNDHRDSSANAKRAAASAPDERDATIDRLERAVAEERQHAATLRATVEQLRFKLEVLEKSYAKQLADARLRGESAERELAEKRARLAALDSGEDTTRLLSEARAELEQVTAERNHLRDQLERAGVPHTRIAARERAASLAHDGTINELMANPDWLRERQSAPDGHLEARVRADQESPPEEMIAPELVFISEKDDDEP
jgi:predicted  nucleic acid-binding Zn-ribbon protein